MNDLYFWAAGGLAALWFCVHLFVGGREIARPLITATTLDPLVRNTQYLCWHFTTVTIASMAAFFMGAAYTGAFAFATAGTILAFGFFVVGVGLVMAMGQSHARLPQGWLFLPVALLGVAGHLA